MKNVLVSDVTSNDVFFVVGARVAYMGEVGKRSEALYMAANGEIGIPSAKAVALEVKDNSIRLHMMMFMTGKNQNVTLVNPKLVRVAGRSILTGIQSNGRIVVLAIID